MLFRVFDKTYPSRLYMAGDLEAQFRDHEAVVSPELAYRISRLNHASEFVIEQKRFPFDPDSWKKQRRLIWNCNMSSANGYGMVAENTVRQLVALGVTVQNPGAISGSLTSGGEYVHESVKQTLQEVITPDCLEIQHCQPPALKLDVAQRIWCYTMFETDHTPRSWIKRLNQVEHVLVPSSWLVDSWKEQGVTVPIDVYHHGIDPEVYSPLERPKRETFTFLHYGQLSKRKGTELLFKAFVDEFGSDPNVRLILKNTHPFFPVPLNQPNVTYIHATYSKGEMRELLRSADCFVFPTRGEGFGLPAFEAMATGCPAIVTGWSGPVDYSHPADTLILSYELVRATEFDDIYQEFFEADEHAGMWAEPSYEDLRAKMRWAVDHRDKLKIMGQAAAYRIAADWSWETQARQLIETIDASI